jgi:hypothetical protein
MKTIHHVWSKRPGFRHHKCERCGAIRNYDASFARLMYTDRFGKISYNTPICVLPNTLLKLK